MKAQIYSRYINQNSVTRPSEYFHENNTDKKEFNFQLVIGLIEMDVPKKDASNFNAVAYLDKNGISVGNLKAVKVDAEHTLGNILTSSYDMRYHFTNVDNLFAGNLFLRKTEFPAVQGKVWMIFGGCLTAKIDYQLENETLYNVTECGLEKVKKVEMGQCIDGLFRLPMWLENNEFSIQSTMEVSSQKKMFELHSKFTNPNMTSEEARTLCNELGVCYSLGVHPDQKYYGYVAELNKRGLNFKSWVPMSKSDFEKREQQSDEIIKLLMSY